jgi:hypothetical protein
MKYLVYFTVGYSRKYINILQLAIRSLRNYYDGDILVICDSSFKDECIEKLGPNIIYFLQPDAKSGPDSSMNKLKIFNFPNIGSYDKVLFLDSDILVHSPILPILEGITRPGYLYCYSESKNPEDHQLEYWSFKTYTSAEIARFKREYILPFNAGTFGFVQCDSMKEHFKNVLNMVSIHRGEYYYEQSFMNVYFNRLNITDRTVFTDENYKMHDIKHETSYEGKIVHFAGDPSDGNKKIVKMKQYSTSFLDDKEIIYFETRDEMIDVLVPKGWKYAEIGVLEATFSDKLCKLLFPRFLALIDLFEGNVISGDQDGNNVKTVDVSKTYTHLVNFSKAYPNILSVLKGDSSTLLRTFPDNTFDMIYVDGDHTYEGVVKDLEVAYQKIKPGGWLMGHDYEMNMKKAKTVYQFGVKKAVDEFCEFYNQRIFAKGMDGCVSYAIQLKK